MDLKVRPGQPGSNNSDHDGWDLRITGDEVYTKPGGSVTELLIPPPMDRTHANTEN
jgi:hypothetical protein